MIDWKAVAKTAGVNQKQAKLHFERSAKALARVFKVPIKQARALLEEYLPKVPDNPRNRF